MFQSVFFLLNTVADGIVKGDWNLVLIILAVCAILGFIFVAMSNGNTGIPGGGIVVVLMLVAWLVLFKLSRNDDLHHPEKFVGHTYELTSSFILAAPTEDAILQYEKETARATRPSSYFASIRPSTKDKYGIVNLAYESPGKWGAMKNRQSTRLIVVASGEANSESPSVEVRPENNAYAGRLYWIPARLLLERGCVKAQ